MGCWNKWFPAVLVLLFVADFAESLEKHYCPVTRSKRVAYQVQRWRSCGWFGWSQCCYYTTHYKTVYYQVNVCCSGYTGCYCHIPICNPPCAVGKGTCVAPNKCECKSVAYTDPTCNTVVCSHRTDCYPGTCIQNPTAGRDPLCVCHNSFNGTNCETMNVGPNITSCSAKLQNWYQGQLRNEIPVKCNLDDVTTRDEATEVYVRDRDQRKIVLDWTFAFTEPQNPPPRPNYVTKYDVGLVDSRVVLNLTDAQDNLVKDYIYECTQANPDTPPAKVTCGVTHESHDAVRENFKYIVSFEATSGGYKTIVNQDAGGRFDTKRYSELTFAKEVHIIYDVEKPIHCTQYPPCPAGDYEKAIPFGLSDDIARTNVTFIIFGWNDTLSGVDKFEYNSFKMAPDHDGVLYENSVSLSTQTWRYGDGPKGIPVYEPTEPGMYSILLSVHDVAGNRAHARSLLLYDNIYNVTTNPDHPMYIINASPESNYTWMTSHNSSGSVEVTVSWRHHFWNKFHYENGLLNAVRGANDNNTLISKIVGDKLDIIEDNEGNRTTDPILNTHGIVSFTVSQKKALHMNNLEHRPDPIPVADLDMQNYTVEYPTVNDGESVKFWVSAADVLYNELTDTAMVSIDNSPPIIGEKSHEINVPIEENPEVPYASRVVVKAWDRHSGIMHVTFTLLDQSEGGVEVYRSKAVSSKAIGIKDEDDCKRQEAICSYCIPMGDCFHNDNKMYVDHCKILERQGHNFSLDLEVANQASKAVPDTYVIGIMNKLEGIGFYPTVKDPRITNTTSSSVKMRWDFHPACYQRDGTRITFAGSRGSHFVPYPTTSYTISDLPPKTKVELQLFIVYNTAGGEVLSEKAALKAETKPAPGGGGGFPGAAIGGIVAGLLLLAILAVLLVVLVLRRRNHFTKTSSRAPAPPPSQRDLGPCTTLNNTYPGLQQDNVRNLKLSNPTYNKACAEEEDEVYVYGNVEFSRSSVKTIMGSAVKYGDIIKQGKFAIIRVATMQDKNGMYSVAAKLLKDNPTEGDRMLMKAKANFHAKEIHENDYILNMYGVVEEGPVMLLELCEKGSLKDWLSSLDNMTPDIIDNMTTLCLHVAKGMTHLHGLNIVHRRLAARNILLTEIAGELHAKVAGFGPLPGNKFEREYMKDNAQKDGRVPVKWMAPELLIKVKEAERQYTKQSDVWSYAVVVWEVFSKGATPYTLRGRHELYQQLVNGYRLEKPEGASDDMYNEVMLKCWETKPLQRPAIEDVSTYFHELLYNTGPTDDEYYGGR